MATPSGDAHLRLARAGFDNAYFGDAVEHTGWTARRFQALDQSPLADVVIARSR